MTTKTANTKGDEMKRSLLRYDWMSAVTVLAGVVVLILDFAGLLSGSATGRAVLALICLLATSEIFGKSAHLWRLENNLEQSAGRILAALGAAEVERLSSSEAAHEYLASAISQAQKSVRHAAIGPAAAWMAPDYKRKYYEAIERTLRKSDVSYVHVTSFCDVVRLHRVKKWLDDPGITKYYVSHYEWNAGTPPTPYFVVLDDREAIVRIPRPQGEHDEYLVVREPKLVTLFAEYHRYLWEQGVHVNLPPRHIAQLEKLEERIAASVNPRNSHLKSGST